MRKDVHTRSGGAKIFPMMILLLILGLFLVGCGEAVSVNGIDTGGGGSNSLMLAWSAPTTNEDGTPLEDLAGYKLYFGNQSRQYTQVITLGSDTTAELANLQSGTYYVTVTAFDIYGNESDFANEINHTFF